MSEFRRRLMNMQNEGITFEGGGSNVVEYTIQTNDKVINITNIGDWDYIYIHHLIEFNDSFNRTEWTVQIMCDVMTDPLIESALYQKNNAKFLKWTTISKRIIDSLTRDGFQSFAKITINNARHSADGKSKIITEGRVLTARPDGSGLEFGKFAPLPTVLDIGRINSIKILVDNPNIQLDKNLGTIKVWGTSGP